MSLSKSSAGLRYLRLMLALPVQQAGAALARAKPYLTTDEERAAVDYVSAHLAAHGVLPSPEAVLDQVGAFLPDAPDTLDYELEQLRQRFVEEGMRDASDAASALLTAGEPDKALSSMTSALLALTKGTTPALLFDLRSAQESALAAYAAQLAGTAPPVQKLGFPTLDAQGGWDPGDMLGVVGKPGSGKTWLMLYLALKTWAEYPAPVLFVTQEMTAQQIERRALPMVAGVDPTPLYRGAPLQYQIGGLTHDQYLAALNDAAASLKHAAHPFLIYDSRMAGTVSDVESIATLHGCSSVFIDGAYMLRHPDRRLNRYQRVPENLDLLKAMTMRTGMRLASSWQFKRGSGKDDAGETPDLDDIGYSHAVGEFMSIVLGLLEQPKSVSQLDKKRITLMKGRGGEVGAFDIHWKFSTMDFDEILQEETQADLEHL